MWGTEDMSVESGLSFHHVGPRTGLRSPGLAANTLTAEPLSCTHFPTEH